VQQRFREYLASAAALQAALDLSAVEAFVELVQQARQRGATIFLCGNGGSATTACHFATDLQKSTVAPGQPRVRALALGENTGLLTAWANDTDYSRVFAEQLQALGRPGDVLVALSASGNSPNVLAAVEAAREVGMTVVALTGFDGGILRGRADLAIHVPVASYELAEDAHLMVCHLVIIALKAAAARGQPERAPSVIPLRP
jgi:D-sedoheptulose 7-phosphate isomerase